MQFRSYVACTHQSCFDRASGVLQQFSHAGEARLIVSNGTTGTVFFFWG